MLGRPIRLDVEELLDLAQFTDHVPLRVACRKAALGSANQGVAHAG